MKIVLTSSRITSAGDKAEGQVADLPEPEARMFVREGWARLAPAELEKSRIETTDGGQAALVPQADGAEPGVAPAARRRGAR